MSSNAATRMYTIRPLTPVFGAEVFGIDIAHQELTPSFIAQLKADITEHRVLLFRKQSPISGQKQVLRGTACC